MPPERLQILDPEKRVAYLRDEKGVAFEIVDEQSAVDYLTSASYFYKTKAYAKCFEKYQLEGSAKGRYINLDFGHLVELERLDGVLRTIVLRLALDIEHAIKTRINAAAMRSGADPLDVSRQFLSQSYDAVFSEQINGYDESAARDRIDLAIERLRYADLDNPEDALSAVNDAIGVLELVTSGRDPLYVRDSTQAMTSSRYSGGIARKYEGTLMPYWCLMELVSFGPLISLYKCCFKPGGIIADERESAVLKDVKNLLRQAQSLRNAAAHGDALTHTLGKYSSSGSMKGVRRKLEQRGFAGQWVADMASVPLAMELSGILMAYETLVTSKRARMAASEMLAGASAQFANDAQLFSKTYSLAAFVKFATKIFDAFSGRLAREHSTSNLGSNPDNE